MVEAHPPSPAGPIATTRDWALRAAPALIACVACVWAVVGYSPLMAAAAGVGVAVLAITPAVLARRRSVASLTALVLVTGELLVASFAVTAAWAAWPEVWAGRTAVLVAGVVLLRIPRWYVLLVGDQQGLWSARLRQAAAVATGLALIAGTVYVRSWHPVSEAALCNVPSVSAGAGSRWPDGDRIEPAAAPQEGDGWPEDVGERTLAGATAFPGNEALGRARWSIPRHGAITGNRSSVAVVGVNGFGVYDIDTGRVRWTLDGNLKQPFGFRDEEIRRIYPQAVRVVGDAVLARLVRQDPWGDRSSSALLALDVRTGERAWCAPGVSRTRVDPTHPERIAAYDGDWTLRSTENGRRVATVDTERGALAKVEIPDSAGEERATGEVLRGGRFVVWRGAAIAVYDAADGDLAYRKVVDEPAVSGGEPRTYGHSIYNVLPHEKGVLIEVDTYSASRRQFENAELIGHSPDGTRTWRRDPPGKQRFTLGVSDAPSPLRAFGGVVWAHRVGGEAGIRVDRGKVAWRASESTHYTRSREQQARGRFLYVSDADRVPTAVDARDGSTVRLDLAGALPVEPVPGRTATTALTTVPGAVALSLSRTDLRGLTIVFRSGSR